METIIRNEEILGRHYKYSRKEKGENKRRSL